MTREEAVIWQWFIFAKVFKTLLTRECLFKQFCLPIYHNQWPVSVWLKRNHPHQHEHCRAKTLLQSETLARAQTYQQNWVTKRSSHSGIESLYRKQQWRVCAWSERQRGEDRKVQNRAKAGYPLSVLGCCLIDHSPFMLVLLLQDVSTASIERM